MLPGVSCTSGLAAVPDQGQAMTRLREWFRPQPMWVWHPESPGIKVLVWRSPLGRLLKPREFATIGEVLGSYLTRLEW